MVAPWANQISQLSGFDGPVTMTFSRQMGNTIAHDL